MGNVFARQPRLHGLPLSTTSELCGWRSSIYVGLATLPRQPHAAIKYAGMYGWRCPRRRACHAPWPNAAMRLASGVAGQPHSKGWLGADINVRTNPADGCTCVLLSVLIEVPKLADRLKQTHTSPNVRPFEIVPATKLRLGHATARAHSCCSFHRDNHLSNAQPKMSRLARMRSSFLERRLSTNALPAQTGGLCAHATSTGTSQPPSKPMQANCTARMALCAMSVGSFRRGQQAAPVCIRA